MLFRSFNTVGEKLFFCPGSKDGFVRLWKCGPDFKSLKQIFKVPVVSKKSPRVSIVQEVHGLAIYEICQKLCDPVLMFWEDTVINVNNINSLMQNDL